VAGRAPAEVLQPAACAACWREVRRLLLLRGWLLPLPWALLRLAWQAFVCRRGEEGAAGGSASATEGAAARLEDGVRCGGSAEGAGAIGVGGGLQARGDGCGGLQARLMVGAGVLQADGRGEGGVG
jgi:hypothetical protein